MIEFTDSRVGPTHRRWTGLISKISQVHKLALLSVALLGVTAADAKVIYVNGGKTSSGDGSSWSRSIQYLQTALDRAAPGDNIYLAKGTYFPDDGVPDGGGDRQISFELDKVNLYGGFAGNESSLSQRNIAANPTILSGKIWDVVIDPDTGELNGADRYWSLHVVKVNTTSRIDGLTIEGGRATGETAPFSTGGGVLVSGGQSLRLANSIMKENLASQSGGAIFGKVDATNCQFIGNGVNNEYNFNSNPNRISQWLFNAVCSGGAIEGEITATNCKFLNNSVVVEDLDNGDTCTGSGGAINGPKITVTNCEFDGNMITADSGGDTSYANGRGGAIFGPTTATRCIFTNNSILATANSRTSPDPKAVAHDTSYPTALGGAIAGKSTVISCVFATNSIIAMATRGDETRLYSAGSALYLEGASTVANSAFVENIGSGIDNSESRGGWVYSKGAILVATGSVLPLSNCTFLNNTSSGNGSALSVEGTVNIISNIFWFDGVPADPALQYDMMIHVGQRPDGNGVSRGRISNRLYPTPSTETINLVAGGFAAVTRGSGSIVDFGEPAERTFIPKDPAFVDMANPAGADGIWRTGDDGLRLTSVSPAIGKGINLFIAKDTADLNGNGNTGEPIPNDLAEYVRVQGGTVDLGAYEFGQQINAPDISVEYPAGTVLLDGQNTIDLSAFSAQARTFVIRNTGNEYLNNLVVSVVGANNADFRITQPQLKSLSLNATTTFTVTFRPGALGNRVAQLRIASNDPDENPFDIALTGNALLPDIAVEYPVGTDLTSGSSTIDYGTIAATTSSTRTFTIRNTGAGNLQIDSIKSSGGNASSFIPSAPGVSFLAPGASTSFTVRFDGAAGDALASTIIVGSSDPDAEAAFKINVKGFGKRAPEIVVSQPFSAEIKTGDKVNYGSVNKNSSYTKTFVIQNTGTADLKKIKVTLSGSKTFSLGKFKKKKLAPGASADFTVTFNPTAKGKKSSTLKIVSNDANESTINITLTGKGVVKKSKKSKKKSANALAANFSGPGAAVSSAASTGSVTLVKGDDGLKYQTLTIKKTSGENPGTVQVSSNLMDWFSGNRHTTTLVDSATVLQVRDNTPVQKGEKRYIRLK